MATHNSNIIYTVHTHTQQHKWVHRQPGQNVNHPLCALTVNTHHKKRPVFYKTGLGLWLELVLTDISAR